LLTDSILKAHLSGQVKEGKYLYTTHLMALDTYRPTDGESSSTAMEQKYHSPLKTETWSQKLATHPDKDYVSYITKGIFLGFHIGFD